MWTAFLPIALSALCANAAAISARGPTYTNPLRENGADPFITYDHDTSQYWFVSTSYTDLRVTSSPTLAGLKTATQNVVFSNETTQSLGNTWAPELHKLNGIWHLYFSLDYHPHVLTGTSNPTGPYGSPAMLDDAWGIDGTVLQLGDASYFVWSCLRPLDGYPNPVQSICISRLITPAAFDTNNIGVISQPDQPWEQVGNQDVPAVNEGPNPLYWAGETYLTYSASFCGTASYSLGLLHYVGGDPINPASWSKKTDGPVFASNNGEYGTGHNANFLSPDGAQVWNVFHAVTNPQGSCGSDRATFVLKLDTDNFDPAVGPRFGEIPPLDTQLAGPSGEA